MVRQTIIFAISFICISSILHANAQGLPGGYSPVKPPNFKNLQTKIQNYYQTALGPTGANLKVKVISACQQVVAGLNYDIRAYVLVNNAWIKCCFKAFQSLPPEQKFSITDVRCGPTCK